VFRSSSLVTSLLLGYFFFEKKYNYREVLGVLSITIGILTITTIEANEKQKIDKCDSVNGCKVQTFETTAVMEEKHQQKFISWVIGISLLLIALFLSSTLGFLQEKFYRKYGKDPNEGMFYTHLLGIPFFLFFSSDLIGHFHIFTNSNPIPLFLFDVEVPNLWVLLFANLVTQLICIQGVFELTIISGTLTCTLVLTIRKFLSLILSILYFNNHFTNWHWIESILVFVGAFFFILYHHQRLKRQLGK